MRWAKLLGGELLDRRFLVSGGQRQRVAMGGALVHDDCVPMDEPLSNLDARLLQIAIERDLLERLSATTIYVTHDQAGR